MYKSVQVVLLAVLWIISEPLIHSRSESAASSGLSALEMSPAKYGGIYRRMLGDNPSTLDPAFVTDVYGRSIVGQIFDGLVQLDANLNPIPALAEFWEASRDGRIWTFTLRSGVKFHHSREMTVHDVIYSFTRLLRVKSPGHAADLLERIQGAKDFMEGRTTSVEGMKAVDRYTLQMILAKPFAPSLTILALSNIAVVPQEEAEKSGDHFGNAPVGTGPFKFVRWERNKEIVLKANDEYYEGRPFLDALVFNIVVGGKIEEGFAKFLKDSFEETVIPSGKLDEVRTDPKFRKYQQVRKPALGLYYVGFNNQLKPFDDKRVRQAFSYAVNTETIVREITGIGNLPATGILPPGMPGYDPQFQGYSYDPVKAKHLLAEAGYPAGAGFPEVQLWSSQKAESTKAELAAYQRYLGELGVKVDIRFSADWPAFREMLKQGKIHMFRLIWVADIPDPDNFLYPLVHSASPTNRTFYRNPLVDQLLEQARRETDDTRRIALYRQVERIVIDDAPWITQHHSVLEYLFQPYVQGVEINLLGRRTMPMKKVWFRKGPTEVSPEAMTNVHPSR
jgi:oligopeptide transport system substrate-binding protein